MRPPIRAALLAVSALALGLGPALSASAAATTGWRQVFSTHYGPAVDYSTYMTVRALAANNAWALGGADGSDGNGTLQEAVAEHWNGTSWQRVAMPAGVPSYINASSAPSASDIWVVTYWNGYVVHWNGTRWSVAKHLTAFGQATGVTALSAANVWVFGGPGSQPGLGTWHFNGTTWQHETGSAVGLEAASALSATSIWAIGYTSAPDDTIKHYNGSAWQRVTAAALTGLSFYSITAYGSANIWVLAGGTTASAPGYLIHYNGSRWTRYKVPWGLTAIRLASDGSGGLWMIAGSRSTNYLVHRTAAGIWSRTTESPSLVGIAHIPGTTSLLAAGWQNQQTGSNAVIWAYGAMP